MRRAASLRGWLAAIVVLAATGGIAFGALTALATRTEASMSFANGQRVWGPFADYWKTNGGLERFGLPITGVYATADGYAAQFFERGVLVYDRTVHEHLVGWAAMAARCTEPAFARSTSRGQGTYFPATGHNLSAAFLDYWQAHNGLSAYGYPLSEPFVEKLSDGNQYTVQYFEKARFEMHGGSVVLGLLGSELMKVQGGPAQFANLPVPGAYPAQAGSQSSAPPRLDHAPDYSWVAGRVSMDSWNGTGPRPLRPTFPPSIVSGSNLVPAIAESSQPTPLPNGVIVGHAVHSDVSPPLRDIKPRPAIPECSPQAGYTFVPTGPGWDHATLTDGEYVRVFGHLAAPGEVDVIGDQGRAYVVDRVEIIK